MQSEARKLVEENVVEFRGADQEESAISQIGGNAPIIATGCAYSGWDMALPLLRKAGLESSGATRFNHEFFNDAGITNPLQLRLPVHPETGIFQSASRFLPETTDAPMLFADSRNLWMLDFWASIWTDARFLLFYTREETALAHALQEGLDPLYFLEGWKAASRQLLSFQRRNRKRVLLLDAEAASRRPRELIKTCRQFGLAVQPLTHDSAPAPAGSVLERLLAVRLLEAQPDKHSLAAELEASSHPLGDTEILVRPEPFELFNDYLKRQASERKLLRHLGETDEKLQAAGQTLELEHEKYRQLQTNHEETQQNLTAQQARAEELRREISDREGDLGEVRRLLQEREAEIARQQALQHEQREEIGRLQWYLGERDAEINRQGESIAWLERQVGDIQRELEGRVAEIDSLNSALSGKESETEYLNAQITEKQLEIEQLLEALSRKERGLEVVRGELGQNLETIEQLTRNRDEQAGLLAECQARLEQALEGKKALETANQEVARENELLLLQLHQVQEELEATFLDKQALEKNRLEPDKQKTEQVEQLTRSCKEQEKLAAERQAQLEQLRKEQASRQQELQKQIDQLSKAKDEQAKLAAQNKTELEKLRQANQTLEATGKEAARENELLLLQLHQVQEELESIFLQKQQLAQAYKSLEAGNLESSRQIEQMRGEIEGKDKKIHKMKQSVSWKMTAPIRGIARPFKRSDKERKNLEKQIELIRKSDLFDEKWYLAEYPDVAKQGMDPVEHYLRFGSSEGRNPSRAFDSSFYLESNPDVAASEFNPLLHYIEHGKSEGRSIRNVSAGA